MGKGNVNGTTRRRNPKSIDRIQTGMLGRKPETPDERRRRLRQIRKAT